MSTDTKPKNNIVAKTAMALLKLDGGNQDKKEDNIVSTVASEIWIKIFHFAYPKRASTLRLVCKQWRDVFNDNYEIKAILSDETNELPNFFQYRRVTECTVVKFQRQTEIHQSLQLFQDPSVLTKLTILGWITRSNFILLVEQCTNVRELIFTGASLKTEAKLFEAGTEEESVILNRFLGNLNKLVITGAYCHTHKKDPAANGLTSKNLVTLFGYEMPKLTTLVVRVNSSTFLVNDVLGFIEKCGVLKHVDVDYITNRWFFKKFPIIQSNLMSTLVSLKISVDTVEALRYWLPLIKIQRKLNTLKIHLESNGYCDYVEEILDVIKENNMLKEIQVDIANIKMPE